MAQSAFNDAEATALAVTVPTRVPWAHALRVQHEVPGETRLYRQGKREVRRAVARGPEARRAPNARGGPPATQGGRVPQVARRRAEVGFQHRKPAPAPRASRAALEPPPCS